MAAGAGALYRIGSVDVVEGNTNIVGNETSWQTALIAIAIGDLFTLDMSVWYEVISVNSDTGITLDRVFEGVSESAVNYCILRNSSGTVLTRIAGQIAVQFNQKQLFLDELRTWLNSSNATESVTDSHGVTSPITTPTQMASEHANRVAQIGSLIDSTTAIPRAAFNALADKFKQDSAGSGFSEWGKKHLTKEDTTYPYVAEGLWTSVATSNMINIGSGDLAGYGTSRTNEPIVNIDGVSQSITGIGYIDEARPNAISLPPAPDGLQRSDGGVNFSTLADAIVAGGVGLTESVITRKDLVLLESFHEKISDKDAVYPLGNVQYGKDSWEGVALSNTLVSQGYSAFGEWDTSTKGYGVVWSTLSDANKLKFLQDPNNNIYLEDNELVQVRYRLRVIEGLGDEWDDVDTQSSQWLRYAASNAANTVRGQGASVDSSSFSPASADIAYFAKGRSTNTAKENGLWQGLRYGNELTLADSLAHNGLCFAVPIALVQRLNSGIYHPDYNPEGCSTVLNVASTGNRDWHESDARVITSTAQCFGADKGNINNGSIARSITGKPTGDPYKYYDAVYAGLVEDLRISSNRKTPQELLTEYSRKGIAGGIRGKEGSPFTFVDTQTRSVSASPLLEVLVEAGTGISQYVLGDTIALLNDTGTIWYPCYVSEIVSVTRINLRHIDGVTTMTRGDKLLGFDYRLGAQYETLPYQEVAGDPDDIASTFPNGVFGLWNPNGLVTPKLIKKRSDVAATIPVIFTADLGATWTSSTNAFSEVDNTIDITIPSGRVSLYTYQSKANPYELADNSKVISEVGDVFAINDSRVEFGADLGNALLGKVLSSYANNDAATNEKLTSIGRLTGGMLYDGNGPKHEALTLSAPTTDAPTVKAFPYITQENRQYYLQWVYKEMIYDTTWGDDNAFNIVDGESAEIDDNGNNVIIGQKRVAIPFFTGEA